MKPYYIGVDIGTSSAKALAFSLTGDILYRHAISYPMLYPEKNRAEQDPEVISDAVIRCIKEVAAHQQSEPALVSFSAAMHGLMAVDEAGKPLTPCITWADTRATAIAAELKQSATGKEIYRRTGVPIHPMSPLCKLIWLRQEEPDIFTKAFLFADIKSWMAFQLFGQYMLDTAVASATGLLHTGSLQWDELALQTAGIPASRLPLLVSTQHVAWLTPNNPLLSFTTKVPFIIGASDGALSNMGTGAMGGNRLSVTIGTSAAVRMMVHGADTDAGMRTFCYHASGDQYITGGASNNGAVVLQWFRESVLQTTDSYDTLFSRAFLTEPGADGLTVLPYLLGERAPLWNPGAKAVFFGLDAHHTQAHLARAIIESICYNIYSTGKILLQKYPVTEIRASGGFVQQGPWLQLLADLFNLPVYDVNGTDGAALGAVMLGVTALQLPAIDPETIVTGTRYEPNETRHQQYLYAYKRFEKLYHLLKDEMNGYC